jgi:SAM-dependent methyltransferase
MYEIKELALASVQRLYDYHIQQAYGADFSVKGFDRPWLVTSRTWKAGERILDIGGAYSATPIHLSKTFGCETWVADDFGMDVNDLYWTRNRNPHEYIAEHPEVKYVLERVGDWTKSSLPENYFDVIYSLSALEHVPGSLTPAVWSHMDRLLKPGGELLHAIDMPFPSNFGISGLLKVWGFEVLFPFLPENLRFRHFRATPRSYLKLALPAIKTKPAPTQNLSLLNMALNPDVLTESYYHGLNRIIKDDNKKFRYTRVTSLLIRLKKIA